MGNTNCHSEINILKYEIFLSATLLRWAYWINPARQTNWYYTPKQIQLFMQNNVENSNEVLQCKNILSHFYKCLVIHGIKW